MTISWTQIKRVLEGVASKDEQELFNTWLNESEKHKEYFYKIEKYYFNTNIEEMKNLKIAVKFNSEQILSNKRGAKRAVVIKKLAIAATVAAALVLVSMIIYNSGSDKDIASEVFVSENKPFSEKISSTEIELITDSGSKVTIDDKENKSVLGNANIKGDTLNYTKGIAAIEYHTLIIPCGKTAVITLEDGTKVHLNSMSQIRYPNKFDEGTRRVYLSGEAYFEVEKDDKRQFIVTSNGNDIKVYGTEFNVKSYGSDLCTNVILVNGSVSVSNTKHSKMLKPGEKAILGHSDKEITTTIADNMRELAWMRNEFYYENIPLETVVNDLMRNYHETIIIQNVDLRDCKVTFCISKDRSLEDIMSTINKNGSIEVIKREESYIIK